MVSRHQTEYCITTSRVFFAYREEIIKDKQRQEKGITYHLA
jgi:hypothetical protein